MEWRWETGIAPPLVLCNYTHLGLVSVEVVSGMSSQHTPRATYCGRTCCAACSEGRVVPCPTTYPATCSKGLRDKSDQPKRARLPNRVVSLPCCRICAGYASTTCIHYALELAEQCTPATGELLGTTVVAGHTYLWKCPRRCDAKAWMAAAAGHMKATGRCGRAADVWEAHSDPHSPPFPIMLGLAGAWLGY